MTQLVHGRFAGLPHCAHGFDLRCARAHRNSLPPQNAIDRYFKITERGSTIGTEIRGGLVTFFTMAYIIVLNPIILGGTDGTGADLAPKATIAATTALVAGVLTILMGLVANFPLALAAGLGLTRSSRSRSRSCRT